MHTSPRHARASAQRILGAQSGAFDLPSIIVGVVDVGILTVGVLASHLRGHPLRPGERGQAGPRIPEHAEGVSKAKDSTYHDSAGLQRSGTLPATASLSARTDPLKSCYAGLSRSGFGKMFFNSSTSPMPQQLDGGTTPDCVTAVGLQGLITSVGGQTTPVQAVSPKTFKYGLAEPNGLPDVESVARVLGEYPAYVQSYTDFTQSLDMASINAVIAQGATPVVTWEPWNSANGKSTSRITTSPASSTAAMTPT